MLSDWGCSPYLMHQQEDIVGDTKRKDGIEVDAGLPLTGSKA